MLTDVIKALFYTCDSYPKIAAPHRFSPSDDFELCTISSIVSTLRIYEDVLRIVTEFKRGERDIKKLGVGKNIAKALTSCFQELKHKMLAEMCITATVLLYINVIQIELEKDFHRALRRFFNAMQVLDVEDSVEFIKAARSTEETLRLLLEKAELSERRALVEGLSLHSVFEELAKQSPFFECFINVNKILEVIRTAEKIYNEQKDINTTLSRLFLDLAKNRLEITSSKLSDILRLDINYRKKGLNLSFLLPYVAYAALYIVKTS